MSLGTAGDQLNVKKIQLGFAPTKTIPSALLQPTSTSFWLPTRVSKDKTIVKSTKKHAG
jgi:hypothetical protein